MRLKITNYFQFDWPLVVAVLFLVAFGLAAIYSVALGQGKGEFLNFEKQIVWLVVSFLVMVLFANIDYKVIRKFSWVAYGLGILMLMAVLTPLGATIRGSRGWFSLGFFSFQPVEVMKIFLIVFLAGVCARYARTTHKFGQMVMIALVVAIPFGLVMLQPDFGSGMVLFFLWLLTFSFLTKNKKHLLLVVALIVVTLAGAWLFVFKDYQKDRIMTFVDPARDPAGSGYNVQQSIIAVGSGGMSGKGLGFGSQSQLKFIPECQTDFIFAVIAEELGFVGVMFLLGFYAIIFWRLYLIAARAPDDYAMFVAMMAAALLFIHLFINVGMGVGLLPVTGISLPFVSYGGSFLLAMMVLVGILNNIYRSGVVARRY